MSRIDIIITENPAKSATNPTGRTETFIENITDKVDGVFSWTIEAFGGFATAHLEMVVSEADAWEMLNRLGKRVAFLHPEAPDKSLICWEGMIHSVNVDDGGATISRSLENCYNKIAVNYTGVDDSRDPPETRGYEGTEHAEDSASVAAYGRRFLIYEAGTIYGPSYQARRQNGGNKLRDLFLSQFAEPRASATTLRRGGGSSASGLRVSVDCVGFVHELAMNFNGDLSYYQANISDILKAIVQNVCYGTAAQFAPYGTTPTAFAASWQLPFVSADTSKITENTNQVTRYKLDSRTTRTYIDDLMRYGDGATGRRTFYGYYENRVFHYTVEPDTYDYKTRRNDPSEAIYDRATGNIVPPWLVRPAKVIGVPDLVPEETSETLGNPRAFLIGTVEFTAPATVVLTPIAPDPSGLWGTAMLQSGGGYTQAEYGTMRPPPTGGG